MDIITFVDKALQKLDEAALPIKQELLSHQIRDLPHQRLLAGQLHGINTSKTVISDYYKQLIGKTDSPEEKKAIY